MSAYASGPQSGVASAQAERQGQRGRRIRGRLGIPQESRHSIPAFRCPLQGHFGRSVRADAGGPLYPMKGRRGLDPLLPKSAGSGRNRHSITKSAAASSVAGTVNESAFAVFKLIDSSNLEG